MTDVPTEKLQVVFPLFPQFTALDAIGPYEVLQHHPGVAVTFVGHEIGLVRTDHGQLAIQADATFEDVPEPDLIVFPGGPGARDMMTDQRVLAWLQAAHTTTRFTTSVCTGSLVLAAAGLLDGLTATTHWGARDVLGEHGATPVVERVVEHLDDRLITAAGVSSGIDMALRLLEIVFDRTTAQASQLLIEYDPQPPFDMGSLEKSSEEVRTRLAEYMATPR